jgi:hypothetical protein
MTHTFKITEAFYPNVYEGYLFPSEDKPTFGLSIKAEELPDHLRIYARAPKDKMGFNIITISAGKQPPTVVTEEGRNGAGQMDSILRFARNANMRLDDLLKKIPMEIAAEVIEFENSRTGPSSALIVKAIKVRYTDLLRRYDEIEVEYWS